MPRNRPPAAIREAMRRNRLERRAEVIGAGIEPVKNSKFHNVKTTYRGMKFDSLGEAEYAAKLDLLVKAGEIIDWEQAKPFVLLEAPTARGRITYKPDFWICPSQGTSYFVDYKGGRITETAAFNLKVKLWRQKVPHELRVVYRDGSEKVVATGNECFDGLV